MAVEITMAPRRMFFQPISWAAVFAALAVGIAVQMLLMLAGLALGLSVVEPAQSAGESISMTAASWSIGSLIVAAFIGGYVASRASGLRRKGDGMLHGVVAWAASTLLYAVLASTVLGQASSGVFGALRPLVGTTAASASASELSGEARSEAIRALESAGLNAEQAADIVNQMARSSGDPAILESSSADEAAARIGMATGWMSAAVLLSLVAGALGGLLGNAGQRRKDHVGKLSHGETRVLGRTAF